MSKGSSGRTVTRRPVRYRFPSGPETNGLTGSGAHGGSLAPAAEEAERDLQIFLGVAGRPSAPGQHFGEPPPLRPQYLRFSLPSNESLQPPPSGLSHNELLLSRSSSNSRSASAPAPQSSSAAAILLSPACRRRRVSKAAAPRPPPSHALIPAPSPPATNSSAGRCGAAIFKGTGSFMGCFCFVFVCVFSSLRARNS